MRLRILLSYHYYKKVDLDDLIGRRFGEPYPELFVDSGGFSAATQGIHVDIGEYGEWLKRWKHWITAYANFDAIGNAAQTKVNQQRMEDMGFHPLPVFHHGEDWSYLEDYLDSYPYIALGGLVPVQWRTAMPWILQAFKRARRTGSVYHGFGVSSWETVKAFPWYSVDSSSWGSGFRFGALRVFDERKGTWHAVNVGDRVTVKKYAHLLRSYGVDPMDVADRKRYHSRKIVAAAALSWVRAEAYCRRIHGDVLLPGQTAGLKSYLVQCKGEEQSRIPVVQDVIRDAGLKLHLADTSSGVHFREANKAIREQGGLKIHLAEANPQRLVDAQHESPGEA